MRAMDDYISKEAQNKFLDVRFEHMIYECLNSGGSICHLKGHYHKLIMSLMSSKSHFTYVIYVLSHLLIIP